MLILVIVTELQVLLKVIKSYQASSISYWKLKKLKYSLCCAEASKKTEISKQLNVSGMTVHWKEQRLNASESLMHRPRLERPHTTSQGAIKNVWKWPIPEYDKTGMEEKNFSLHCAQDGKKDIRKTCEGDIEPLLSASMVQS